MCDKDFAAENIDQAGIPKDKVWDTAYKYDDSAWRMIKGSSGGMHVDEDGTVTIWDSFPLPDDIFSE